MTILQSQACFYAWSRNASKAISRKSLANERKIILNSVFRRPIANLKQCSNTHPKNNIYPNLIKKKVNSIKPTFSCQVSIFFLYGWKTWRFYQSQHESTENSGKTNQPTNQTKKNYSIKHLQDLVYFYTCTFCNFPRSYFIFL